MDCIEAHWNRRSASYNDFVVKGFADRRERGAWEEHYSSILGSDPLNVLDVGCGPGIVSMQLADLGHRVTSVDLCDDMLACARRNAADNGLDIDFRKGNAMSLDFPAESFDAVVSGYMLWTVPDPAKVVSEWFRVLKSGGTLAFTDGDWFNDPLSTPLRCRISDAFVGLVGTRDPGEPDTDRFEDAELWSRTAQRPADDLRMLAEAGFEDVHVIHNVQKRVLHGARYYAYGYTNDHYTVVARKPRSLRRADEERERQIDRLAVRLDAAGVPAVRLDGEPLHPELDQVVHVPLGAALPAQREVSGYVPDDVRVDALYRRVPAGLPVAAGLPELIVVQVQIVVPVEEHQPPAVPQDAEPLAVGAERVLEVPDDVAGDHEIERPVLEIEVLSVHPLQTGINAVSGAVRPRLLEHPRAAIHPGDAVALPSEDHWEEPGPGADVEDIEGPAGLHVLLHDVEPVVRSPGVYRLGDGL